MHVLVDSRLVDLSGSGWAAVPQAPMQQVWLLPVEPNVLCVCSGPGMKGQRLPWEALLLAKAEAPEGKLIFTSTFQAFACIVCINFSLANQSPSWIQGQGAKYYRLLIRQGLLQSHLARAIGRGENWDQELSLPQFPTQSHRKFHGDSLYCFLHENIELKILRTFRP